jgi:hypothetical protein
MGEDKKNEAKGLKPTEERPKGKREKKGETLRKPRRKRAAKDPQVEYEGENYRGVEIDDEGRLRLLEKHYFALTLAEQEAKLKERDLELERLKEAAYRKEIESRLPPEVQRQFAEHAARVQEANTKLAVARKQYRDEAQDIEKTTGLKLRDWLIDDMRRMRHVEKL